ncbi:3-oxoacyl-[acyl-carrier-protein] synthase 2 [Rickettsiales endosymbiont of Paramecium tredecaurelia]|uniref:beta-ketoacyl-ACP synthase II n=1 Tax=Candidatus Sarmatiella mevalonica TaxID=2770581 RepID=UPI00192225D9|nr:beta-ketoacyl-ACP synthase II [Candidatus Sarmatiella mevalonica]MBL3284645.1 3-oxoacyl-[acyl-carrier-protein] synthase 2 [Candidatus Sarmatiella mevalonica]
MLNKKRVVVTGIGAVTPLAQNAINTWHALIAGKSGIRAIDRFDTTRFSSKIGGMICDDFKPEAYIRPQDLRKMDLFIQYGIAASKQAIEDSAWVPSDDEQKERTAVILGSGIGGLQTIENTSLALEKSLKNNTSPFFIPASLINLLPGHVSLIYDFRGPNFSVVTACASGANAICEGYHIIQNNYADVVVAGGAEAPITPVGVAGFAAARALSTKYNDQPASASRPWDKDRDGFVIAEGAAVVVLEEYEHALARGAKIYCELLGCGMSGDAYHITSPEPTGRGAYNAMKQAVERAGVDLQEIGYISAHGTSTQAGDEIELKAVSKLYQACEKKPLMSSTKSATGHLLGAAGSLEFALCIFALQNQIAPPTLNLHNSIDSQIDLVPLYAKQLATRYAMSNSFGFGGTNTSIILGLL